MEHYRDFIKTKYVERKRKNTRYSMRAFAQSLGISAAGLGQILSGKKELSLDRALEFSKKMGLTSEDADVFLFRVQFERAKSHPMKDRLLKDYEARFGKVPTVDLSLEQFRLLNEWHGLAVYEALKRFPEKMTSKRLAILFDVDRESIELTLGRLERLELIESLPNGGYQRLSERILVATPLANDAVRNYFESVLVKANEAIRAIAPLEKVIGTEVILMAESAIPEAKRLTEEYWSKMKQLGTASVKANSKTKIYQGFCTLFPITKNIEGEIK